ncbi:sulfotransferase domain-containing protein [Gloeocapsopsis crepidinum LEGE 06123]|uniref:Sulfotransferase domain-containing protein n=1 Tax=Gloeocapsopsis crepidinum LEGE 06123 TaxID=588587 RepID=A0ABR9UXZ5_9CHRO|nr:sulfotransferase domain-containing protein [Gloeocapsopsis crepidinum]MBE9193187.1 sulfotransferase domain-containing protein [Gloeocapsopsis crepidinum LEGE 06123]
MIIISSSIPKSGSTLVFNYQKDLLELAILKKSQPQTLIHLNHTYIQSFNIINISRLICISFRGGDAVIKTHSKPVTLIKLLLFLGLAKATFCYRDPRDVILSAIDYGSRTRKGLDSTGAFQDFQNIIDSIPKIKNCCKNWQQWQKVKNVLFIKYEDLMQDKLVQLKNLAAHFELELNEDELRIHNKHEKLKSQAWNFNKGTIQRYKTEMNCEELKLCNTAFQRELMSMGYKI